jgi:hypothetical protein
MSTRAERAERLRRCMDGLDDMEHSHIPFVAILHLASKIWKLEVCTYAYMYMYMYMYIYHCLHVEATNSFVY